MNHPASARLSGKACIVTGAASGIGRATAVVFAQNGARVMCVDIAKDAVSETAAIINKRGGEAFAHVADVGDEAANEQMVAECVRRFGTCDVLFANAGIIGSYGSLQDTSAEEVMRTMRINVLGVFMGIKYASQAMIKAGNGGSIVCTASVAGMRSGAGPIPYSASKAAVINMVATAANELALTGVRVNAVLPGLVETGMTGPLFMMARSKKTEHKIGQLNPTGRPGFSDEIANAVLFLASDEASYVNGQALPVCGGLSSSHPVVPRRSGSRAAFEARREKYQKMNAPRSNL